MKKSKWLVSFAAFIVASLSMGIIGVSASETASSNIALEEIELATSYTYGESFCLPEASVLVDGKKTDTECILVYPDGTAVRNSEVSLSAEGVYTLRYVAKVGGKQKIFEKRFSVEKTLYNVSSSASSAYYGTYTTEGKERVNGNTVSGSVEGIQIALAKGDTFYYNGVIDLSKMTGAETLFDLVATPSVLGEEDCSKLTVTLTDAYDPTIQMAFCVNVTNSGVTQPSSYLKAKTTDQPFTGYEGGFDKLHVNSVYGNVTRFNFGANLLGGGGLIGDNALRIGYDYEEMLVCNLNHLGSNYVCDLDSDDFTKPFAGFTTGEVFLSINVDTYVKDRAYLCLAGVYGQDLANEKVDETMRNTDIRIDLDGYDENHLPEAVVGEEYALFEAEALNAYFDMNVVTRVYANYGESNCYEVNVQNGKFVPTRAENYTIVYSAADGFGNESRKALTVKAVDGVEDFSFVFSEDGYTTKMDLGHKAAIMMPEVTGGSGRVELTVKAVWQGKEIAIEDGVFYPNAAGIYKIVYTATDYIGNTGEFSYKLNVVLGVNPVFEEDVILPKYFISGTTYKIPGLTAYDYSSGEKIPVTAKITKKDRKGTTNVLNNLFTPEVEKSGDIVTVVYTANTATSTAVKTYEVPCIRNDEFDLSNFWYSGNGNVGFEEGSVFFEGDKEGASVDFINAVVADNFSVRFNVDEEFDYFGRLNMYFTDSVNDTQKVKVSYYTENGATWFSVNDGKGQQIGQRLDDSNSIFLLNYRANGKLFTGDNENNIRQKVETTVSGEAFEGFSSGKVYFTMEYEEVTYKAKIYIKNLCDHLMSDSSIDESFPKLSLLGNLGVTYNIGDTAVIPLAIACDVIDPNAVCTLTITAPDGTVVTAESGEVIKDYIQTEELKIHLKQYGAYAIAFRVEDASENGRTYRYSINVLDSEAPQISFDGEIRQTASVGDTVYIPACTVTDNHSKGEELTLTVLLVTPNGYAVNATGNAFEVKDSGIYKVIYIAVDAAGNMTRNSYTVIVS